MPIVSIPKERNKKGGDEFHLEHTTINNHTHTPLKLYYQVSLEGMVFNSPTIQAGAGCYPVQSLERAS